MNISLTKIIESWITDNSKVIDFGCGDGSLLQFLIDNKNVNGYGVEIDHEKIQQCVEKGLSVIEQDIDEGIQDFVSSNFDFAIMASSIQCLKNPHIALGRMLDLSKQCVVTLPNLGYWNRIRKMLYRKDPLLARVQYLQSLRLFFLHLTIQLLMLFLYLYSSLTL